MISANYSSTIPYLWKQKLKVNSLNAFEFDPKELKKKLTQLMMMFIEKNLLLL